MGVALRSQLLSARAEDDSFRCRQESLRLTAGTESEHFNRLVAEVGLLKLLGVKAIQRLLASQSSSHDVLGPIEQRLDEREFRVFNWAYETVPGKPISTAVVPAPDAAILAFIGMVGLHSSRIGGKCNLGGLPGNSERISPHSW